MWDECAGEIRECGGVGVVGKGVMCGVGEGVEKVKGVEEWWRFGGGERGG